MAYTLSMSGREKNCLCKNSGRYENKLGGKKPQVWYFQKIHLLLPTIKQQRKNMKQPELGKQISELRKNNGLTQEELAEQCKITVRTLQRIESGDATPRNYTLVTIFNALEKKNGDPQEKRMSFGTHYFGYLKNCLNFKTVLIVLIVIITAVLILKMPFAGRGYDNDDCKYEDSDYSNLQTSPVTSVNAHVKGLTSHVHIIKLVEAQNDAIFYEGGVIANGIMNVDLPDTLHISNLYRIWNKHPKMKKSDNDALFAFAKLEAYDKNGNLIGVFEFYNPQTGTYGQFIYADRDVTITGKDNACDTWRTSFKRGWNFVFYEQTDDGFTVSTSYPDDMVWHFN